MSKGVRKKINISIYIFDVKYLQNIVAKPFRENYFGNII